MSSLTPPPKVRVGLIGCGKISDAYFSGCRRYEVLEMIACADLDPERARLKAEENHIRALTVDELLALPEIDLVINLTIPQAHADLNQRILRAGKHAYVEKPFALDSSAGDRVLAIAREYGRLCGCAPDTVLGGGIQTARKLLDDGAIGTPVSGLAFMLCRGHESWHPAPEFYYQGGGGPMFDMGPYYLTALINLLGPIARVSGSVRTTFPQRTITSAPLAGKVISVDVPTHYSGTLEFVSGPIVTIVMSFDTWPGSELPPIVLYGSEGTLEVPDPNTFKGPVRLRKPGQDTVQEIALTHTEDRARGSGVADLAYATLRPDRALRCDGALANHVVEVMEAFEKSFRQGQHIAIRSTCLRPAALPLDLPPNRLDS